MAEDRLRLVGLTGGIGSGKSTVARLLAGHGFPVIDADQLAREAVAPGAPALGELAALWPDVVGADGALNRRALAARVFADGRARRRLETILHPRIVELSHEKARALEAAGHRIAIYEASLLVETGRNRDLDGLIVVTAPESARIARVVARDGVSEPEVRARVAAQLPEEAKVAAATYVIANDGDQAALEHAVADLATELRGTLARP